MRRNILGWLLLCCWTILTVPDIAFPQETTSTSDPAKISSTSVVVSIPSNNQFYFGKDKVTQAEILEKIKQAFKGKSPEQQVVYIKAAKSVNYGIVVTVMDSIREAGFERIGLIAETEKPAEESPQSEANSPSNGIQNTPSKPAPDESNINAPSTISELLLIEVKMKMQIRLNSRAVSLSRLPSALSQLLNRRTDKTVFIKAPKRMRYSDIVKVIDIAKAAGAQPIGLQIDYLQ